MAYSGLDAKKLLQNVANSQVLSGQPQLTPEQQAQQQAPQQNTTGLVAAPTAQPTTPIQTNVGKPAPSSGSFTNLQQYVQKNQPGADKLSGAVQQNLQTAAERAKKDIAQTQQKFGTELESGSLQGRDTAVQEALKVAQRAAGGIQTPVSIEDRTAKYKQPIETLQAGIATTQKQLDDAKKSQESFQQYQSGLAEANKLADYSKNYANWMSKVGQDRNKTDNTSYQGELLSKELGKDNLFLHNASEDILRSQYGGKREALVADIQRDPSAFLSALMSRAGRTGDPVNDAIAEASRLSKVKPNTSGAIIQDAQVMPKYRDMAAEVSSLQKNLGRSQQDVELYQGLSKLTPEQANIPEILKQAANFEGDVSEERFKEILNAAYGGPRNLYDIQGYDKALSNTREAERRLGMVSDRGIQQDLLDTTFKGQGRDYTSGLRGLDQLLLGTPERLQQLQQTKKGIGSVQDVMSQAENLARLTSSERSDLIDQIKQQSRGQVQNVASARAGQVDERLANVVQNWDKLPQYFRDAIGKGQGNVGLSDVEAAILGVNTGEGLYNTVKDVGINNLIQANKAEKEQLVSKSEQSQLAELQRLAQMGQDYGVQGSGLDYKSAYQDAERAGTQTAFDAINTQKLREYLNEAENKFRDTAGKTTIAGTGVGASEYKDWKGKTKLKYERANISANMKDVLSKAGYDFNAVQEAADKGNPESKAILEAAAGLARGEGSDSLKEIPEETMAAIYGMYGPILGQKYLGDLGKVAEAPIKAVGKISDKVSEIDKNLGGIGNLFTMGGLNFATGALGGLTGSSKAKAVDTAYQYALQNAQKDLAKNTQAQLQNVGFTNRFDVNADNEAARARRLQLAQTLAQLDPTNTKTTDEQVVENPFTNTQDMLQLARRINKGYRR